jgi:hypothetical protein
MFWKKRAAKATDKPETSQPTTLTLVEALPAYRSTGEVKENYIDLQPVVDLLNNWHIDHPTSTISAGGTIMPKGLINWGAAMEIIADKFKISRYDARGVLGWLTEYITEAPFGLGVEGYGIGDSPMIVLKPNPRAKIKSDGWIAYKHDMRMNSENFQWRIDTLWRFITGTADACNTSVYSRSICELIELADLRTKLRSLKEEDGYIDLDEKTQELFDAMRRKFSLVFELADARRQVEDLARKLDLSQEQLDRMPGCPDFMI